jgi:hypothetical protein
MKNIIKFGIIISCLLAAFIWFICWCEQKHDRRVQECISKGGTYIEIRSNGKSHTCLDVKSIPLTNE